MKYTSYTVDDFVNDPYFRKWVNSNDQQCEAFWQEFMQQHPEKISLVEDARELVLFLSFDLIGPSKEDQAEVKSRILREISADRQKELTIRVPPTASNRSFAGWKRYYAAAAVVIGIALTSLVFTLLNSHTRVIHTPYAQTRKMLLPDGSSVTLNANSTLRFADNWTRTHKREVWLTGEAFFDIRKKPEWANAGFTVHTDGLHVEVLGTTFNVNTRRGKVKVVLNTGKVTLMSEGNSTDTLTMQPKDLVEFTTASKAFIKKKVNPEEHSAWRNHTLVFNEITLQEIAIVLEDTYGLKVYFEEPGLKLRKFTGAIPNHNISLFLTILSQSMNIQLKKSENTIYIHT